MPVAELDVVVEDVELAVVLVVVPVEDRLVVQVLGGPTEQLDAPFVLH